eukprot:3500947-Pyramimonas_sp.AAC.1
MDRRGATTEGLRQSDCGEEQDASKIDHRAPSHRTWTGYRRLGRTPSSAPAAAPSARLGPAQSAAK